MSNPRMSSNLSAAIEAIKKGGMVVLIDDEGRENEGDLVMAAEHATPEAINFMVKYGRGLVCLPLEAEQIERLELPMMTPLNTAPLKTAFTVSIEAREGVTTGISAADRARTIQVACNPNATATDLVTPGHIFPLRAMPGGVLARAGHTEGAVDLARMAGLNPAGVICEILSEDGTMARLPELKEFAATHNLPLISIEEMVQWRQQTEECSPKNLVKAVAKAALPSEYGGNDLMIHAFKSADGVEHVALVKGNPADATSVPLIRLHSECVTGDALGSLRCDCGNQLREALRMIAQAPSGVLLYLRGHEGRGIGLANKVRAYALQDQGYDTVEANHKLGFVTDARDWSAAGAILEHLGVNKLNLLTNNPEKVTALEGRGFVIEQRIPLEIASNPFNKAYLNTKRTRMGHHLASVIESFTS